MMSYKQDVGRQVSLNVTNNQLTVGSILGNFSGTFNIELSVRIFPIKLPYSFSICSNPLSSSKS
jgi:hypothetical protein